MTHKPGHGRGSPHGGSTKEKKQSKEKLQRSIASSKPSSRQPGLFGSKGAGEQSTQSFADRYKGGDKDGSGGGGGNGTTVYPEEYYIDPDLFEGKEGERLWSPVKEMEGMNVPLWQIGKAVQEAFFEQRRKSGLKKGDPGYETLEQFRDRMQADYEKKGSGINLRKAMHDWQKATTIDAPPPGQTVYQQLMNDMRTGKLGPQPQSLYEETFPKTAAFLRGTDIVQQPGGLTMALAKNIGRGMFGKPDWKNLLPGDQRKEWYDALNRKNYGVGTGAIPDAESWNWRRKWGDMVAEGEELSFPIKSEYETYLEGLPVFDPTSDLGAYGREGILGAHPGAQAQFESQALSDIPIAGQTSYDGLPGTTVARGTPPPDNGDGDTTPPPDQEVALTSGTGNVSYWDPVQGKYVMGGYGDYLPFAQVRDGGIINLNDGGYLNGIQAAESLMFKDPNDEEEWEYNV